MRRRTFIGAGVASIAAGALHSTGAFSSLSAGRGVSVNAADDPSGLLGIENVDTTDDPVFKNNTALEMTVTLEAVDTGVTFDGEESPFEFSLDVSESRTVEIETGDDSEGAVVDCTAELFDGGVSKGTITLQRDFSVPQSAVVDFTGEADTAGSSGKFEFELENVGDKGVTLTGIGINATTADANEVSRDGNSATLDGDGTDLVTTSIPIDSDDPTTNTRRDFDSDFPLGEGETADFEFFRFRDSDGNNLDMRDQNVRITVYFGDDSQKTIDLCLDDASCGTY